jgi:predicted metal-dependent hydrolase
MAGGIAPHAALRTPHSAPSTWRAAPGALRYPLPVQLGLPLALEQDCPPADHVRQGYGGRPESATQVDGGSQVADPAPSIYFVRHRRARRYLLRLDHEGRVRVTIPRGGSRREADAFARRHAGWIARQRARFTSPRLGAEEQRTGRAGAAAALPPRLLALAAVHGLQVARVSIRNQRTRWGSCGRDGHITLNWRLVLMPDAVRDYVLIHELMHLRRLDHSPAFWRLVEAACPDYRDARRWLKAHGSSLR